MGNSYAATGKFTTLTGDELIQSMRRVEGTSVVATVNEDHTPNAAIFVPMLADEQHLVMTIANNRTRENIERTKTCMVVYDVSNPQAEQKSERHRGARMHCTLLDANTEEYQRIAQMWPHFSPYTLVLRVEDICPIG